MPSRQRARLVERALAGERRLDPARIGWVLLARPPVDLRLERRWHDGPCNGRRARRGRTTSTRRGPAGALPRVSKAWQAVRMPTSGLPASMYLRMIAICFGRGRAAADAQDQQVGVVECLDPAEVVRRLGVGDHERAAHAQRLELLGGERRQGRLGLVLILADQEDGAGAVVGLELERAAGRSGRSR